MAKSIKTVVFIDPNVTDWQNLVNGVEPGSLVFILDPRGDGIRQITDKLAALTDIDSVQIISHGGEGSLSLGSTQLNSANLNSYSSQLQQWGQSLTTTGDILLYGCDVAQGVVGKAFVQQISQLTGADVAASDDLTGSAALGGDWLLEYATGLIEAPLALQIQAMEAYTAVLPDYVVGGYYTNWSTYGRNFQVKDIPADKLTHVFYAFTKIENGEVALTDPWADIQQTFGGKYTWQQSQAGLAGNLAELKALKQNNPNLKTMMSVGGWTLSSPFSDAALTDSSRTKFATSAVQLMVKYGFDGLDIDWEYPVGGGEAGNINRPEDKQNYTLLLQTLRQELNKQQTIDGKQYQLTIASPAGASTMANLELAQISQYIDFFNLMAYDYHGSTFESTTNHNAPLYAGLGQQSIDSTIQGYLNAGVAAEDIVLGAPAYGYGWAGVPNINNGLFQSSSGKASGTWATGVYDYKDLYNKLQTQPSVYTRYWDDIAKVPYIYSPTDQGGMFSSYEDSQSIGIKTNYIKDKGLGGMFFWDLSSDLAATNNDSLVNNAYKYLTLGQNPGGSPSITLAVSPNSVTEDGTANLIYTFTRTGATTNALTVNYGITGTADSSDYTGATPGTGKTITFAAGASTATLTIDPTADTTVESDETVALTLATGTGYTIGTTTAVTGTITNDDFPTITLAVSPSSVTEDGTTNLIYTFTRTGATTSALTVNYDITGTANSSDYTGATPGTGKTITFAVGSSTATLTIDPTADTTIESNETVVLTLTSGTGYTVGTTTAVTGTITNDDVALPGVTLAVSPSSVLENGVTNLIYTFTRTGATTNALTVNYGIAGTATFNNDYTQIGAASFTATTGTITFAAGSSTKTLTIDPTADTTVESNETVAVTLATGTGYTVGTTTAVTGTITNDDIASPSITLAVSPSSVTEDGTANLIYTFTRTGATTNALTINYNVAGTATFNNDYTQIGAASFTATTGTITFAAGSSTKTLTIDPTADTTVESNETVALTLATGTGYTIGTTTAVTGTITNDDTAGPLTLTGDATNNNLVGGSGNDTFLGLGGQDTLTGGLGADRFRFNSPIEGMDTITDFSKTQGDKIELFGTGFNSLVWTDGVSNALAPSVFSMGTSANSWTNSIIYNNSNGIVYFDADALGSGSQVALAQLSPGLNLTNQDFIVSWV